MKHIKIINESSHDPALLMPLLRVAYNSVKDEINTPPSRPLPVTLGDTRNRMWMCHWKRNYGQNTAKICFVKRGRTFRANGMSDITFSTVNEMVVTVAAWTFAAILVRPALGRSCAVDALRCYRDNQAKIDAEVEAIIQARKDKEGDDFAAMVFDGVQKSTLDYKLSQIEKKEKAWIRKFKLASTKLKSLRRRRAALIAADRRKQRTTEAQVAAAALPPQAPTP